MNNNVDLVELISGLRTALSKARDESLESDIHFEVGPVELEVTVSVSKKGTAQTGLKLWVVTAEGGGEIATAGTQRIKLSLNPKQILPLPKDTLEEAKIIKGPLDIHDIAMTNED